MIQLSTEGLQSATPWPRSEVVIHKPKTFQECVNEVVDEFMELSSVMGRPEINVAMKVMAAEIVSLRRELSWAEERFEECLKERKV